jgi:hypothetical protein
MLVGQWREIVINPPSRYRFSCNVTPVTRDVEISRNARVFLSLLDAGSSPDWPLGARAAIAILGWVLTNRLLMIGDITGIIWV